MTYPVFEGTWEEEGTQNLKWIKQILSEYTSHIFVTFVRWPERLWGLTSSWRQLTTGLTWQLSRSLTRGSRPLLLWNRLIVLLCCVSPLSHQHRVCGPWSCHHRGLGESPRIRVSAEGGTGTEVRDGLFWRGVRDGLLWRGGRTKRDKLKRILFFLFYCGQREITLSTEGPFEKVQRLCRFHSSRSSVPRKPNRNKMNDNKTESQNVFFNKCVCQRENMFEWGKMTSTLLVRSIFKPRMSFSSWVLNSLHWSYKCSRHTWKFLQSRFIFAHTLLHLPPIVSQCLLFSLWF